MQNKVALLKQLIYIPWKMRFPLFQQTRDIPPNVGSMLFHRLRRWPNIDPPLGGRFLFAGLNLTLHENTTYLTSRDRIRFIPTSKSKSQYLLTLQVSRYCLLTLQSSIYRRPPTCSWLVSAGTGTGAAGAAWFDSPCIISFHVREQTLIWRSTSVPVTLTDQLCYDKHNF